MKWYQWSLLRDLILLLSMYILGVTSGYIFLSCGAR